MAFRCIIPGRRSNQADLGWPAIRLARFACPLIVVWSYGKGRSMAFASDIAPHWGAGFEPWEFYEQFWDQVLNWLASR